MSCCSDSYNGLPCCCLDSQYRTTTTTCPFEICCDYDNPCAEIYSTDCVVSSTGGQNYTQILEGILSHLSDLCSTTTTSTTTSTSTTSTTTTTTAAPTTTSTSTTSTSTTSTSTSSTSTTSTSTTSTTSTTSSTTSTTSSTTTTTTEPPSNCFCLNWSGNEVTTDTIISWTDCDGTPQELFIPFGTLNIDVTRCGINPDSDNPGEITATQDTKPCKSQPNGTFVCVESPCTLYYLKVLPPYDVDPVFVTDYYYDDCNTLETKTGVIGLGSPLGVSCLAVYAIPGSIGPTAYLNISTTPC